MKCPHCAKNIDVRFVKAPDDLQPGNGAQVPSAEVSGDLGEILGAIDDGSLKGQAVEFVKDMRERFGKYQDRTKVSPKQIAWLRKLAYGEDEDSW